MNTEEGLRQEMSRHDLQCPPIRTVDSRQKVYGKGAVQTRLRFLLEDEDKRRRKD